MNDAVVEPAGTLMRDGTKAMSGGKLIRVTVVASVEEGFNSFTVAVVVCPPTSTLGEIVKDEMAGVAAPIAA